MSVRGRFVLENVAKMEATMTITMTVGEWEELQAQLGKNYPSWRLSSLITNLVLKAKNSWLEEGRDQ